MACGSSPIKINYFDYPNHFINRINKYYDFSLKYRYHGDVLLKKHNSISKHLFCCNQTCYYAGMVSVTSASRYVTSASHYRSISSMYIRGLIKRNLSEVVPIDGVGLQVVITKHALFSNQNQNIYIFWIPKRAVSLRKVLLNIHNIAFESETVLLCIIK